MASWIERGIFIALLAVAVGLFIHGSLRKQCSSSQKNPTEPTMKWRSPNKDDLFGEVGEKFVKELKAENIENYLKYLTSQGHMAGTKQDLEQAEYLKDLWTEQGIDQVYLQPYDVQLSHPNLARPNKIYLLDDKGEVKFTSSILEDPLDGVAYDDSIPPAFLAFAPEGTIQTNELVYVNYGRYEDFEQLSTLGVSVKNRLVICRLGQTFRGDKIQNAQRFNASGIILYTDPFDYHPDYETTRAYPHSYWLPGNGIQRGSIVWHDGDPTTPLYPAIDGAYRIPTEETDSPKIPAHVLSYNDARKLLVHMGGKEAPTDWQGKLDITYKIGPELATSGWSVKLEVHNIKHIVPTYNVIGIVTGWEEPDRYVILGNHRDAWTFGSLDPSSATAVQMELARGLGKLRKQGWRPRRSIVLGSWGAGEYGFFGPTEWVEEYLKVFEQRAVAHLNLDLAIIFTYNILISATPLLHKVIIEATKKVPAPDERLGFKTLWEHWSNRVRAASPDLLDYNLGSISEHSPFYQRIGVPTSYMVWEINFEEMSWTDYPLYHSTFEDFDVMKNILDPEFRYHLTTAQLWGLMAIGLADNVLLPMDPQDETILMEKLLKEIQQMYGELLEKNKVSLEHLENIIAKYSEAAIAYNQRVQNITNVSPLEARQLNDQLLLLEKCFIDDEGVYLRRHLKNVILGPDNFNQYGSWLAPGLREALWAAERCHKTSTCPAAWEEVKQQVAVVITAINSAVLTLKDYKFL